MSSESTTELLSQVLVKPYKIKEGKGKERAKGNPYLANIVSELPDNIADMKGNNVILFTNSFFDTFNDPNDLLNTVVSARLKINTDNNKSSTKLDDGEGNTYRSDNEDIIKIDGDISLDDLMDMKLRIYPLFDGDDRTSFEKHMLEKGNKHQWLSNDGEVDVIIFEDLKANEFVIYPNVEMVKINSYSSEFKLTQESVQNMITIGVNDIHQKGFCTNDFVYLPQDIIDSNFNPEKEEKTFLENFQKEANNERLFYDKLKVER